MKIIGATSRYLDEDPVMAQDVPQLSRKDNVRDFTGKEKDLEKVVLSQVFWLELPRKVLSFPSRTIVLEQAEAGTGNPSPPHYVVRVKTENRFFTQLLVYPDTP